MGDPCFPVSDRVRGAGFGAPRQIARVLREPRQQAAADGRAELVDLWTGHGEGG